MARARNIKPGFFGNELLAELPFEFRLLFIGLWTLADRAGRLEYRPKKIRAALFPFDSVDVERGVEQLCKYGFAVMYEMGGKLVLQIANWEKHQNPHFRERASEIEPPNNYGSKPEAKPGPDSGDVVPGPGPAVLIPDSLIPDSGFLIPDSKTGARKAAPLVLPAWLPLDVWNDWHDFRNSRKGWTAKAKALSLRTLAKLHAAGHDPRAVVERSIEHGWTGLYELASGGHRGNQGNSAVERVQRNNARDEARERGGA